MTISSTMSKVSYNGNGSTVCFPVPFYFIANGDIVATHVSVSGAETTLDIYTDYTLSGAGNPSGGALTMLVAPLSGEKIIIKRSPAQVQETAYVENAAFPARPHEQALDRLTMMAQDLQEQVGRAVLVPISSSTSPEDLLDELADDVVSAAASAATATTQAGLATTAKTAAQTAQGLAEDARDAAQAAVGGVKVSADDTTPAPLSTKILAGSNIILTVGNDGGNETLTFDAVVADPIALILALS